MKDKRYTSQEDAAIAVYVGMWDKIYVRTYGNGTFGSIEINTIFSDKAEVSALISALQQALKIAGGYNDGK